MYNKIQKLSLLIVIPLALLVAVAGAEAAITISGTTFTLSNSDTIDNATDGQFLFTRNTDAAVTLMAADSSGATNLTIDTTGAGAITVGSADVTSLTVTTDGGSLILDGNVTGSSTRATADTGSYQTISGDLTYQGAAGGTSTYHAGVMGNFMGDTLTNASSTIHAGVIGKYSVTTSDALTGAKAGLVGEAETSVANAAIMAVLGGDTGTVTPNAAYGVQYFNSTAASKFSYGLDLFHASTTDYGDVSAVDYGTADIRLQNQETIANSTNGTITFGRNDAGTVTLTAADTDAIAALTILPGGAAAFTLGGASTTGITLTTNAGTVTISSGNLSISDGEVGASKTRATGATGSFQTIWGDVTYQGAAGGTSTYHAGVMGNFMGDTLTNASSTIHAGVIGKYSVTTSDALTGPQAGLVGEAETSVADAAIMAVLGGDTGTVTPNAAYGVQYLNSTGDSKFSYGLDLFHASTTDYGDVSAVDYGTADIRLQNGETISNKDDGVIRLTGSFAQATSTVASAATVTLPVGNVINVTGTTNITTLNTCDAANAGRVVTLIFADVLVFTDGNNLKIAGNFTTSADDTITLACDGSNWFEMARSAN